MSEEKLNLIASIMEEQLKWTKLAGRAQLRSIFENNLKTDDERRVYELSDGERSTRDIAKLTNVNKDKISLLWRIWYKIGIMEKSKRYEGKRMKKFFSLSEVGIEVEIPEVNSHDESSREEFD